MSEPLSKIKILLDNDPSERFHFVVLDSETPRYMSVKISSAIEHIERELIPKFDEFVPYAPQGENEENMDEKIVETGAEISKKYQHFTSANRDNLPLTTKSVEKNEVVSGLGDFEEFINYSEASVFRPEEYQHFTSANYDNLPPTGEKNEVVSDLDSYNNCVPVRSSELYTSEISGMQYKLHDLHSEIEIEMYLNSLSNTENDNAEGLPTFYQLF
ncbi:hypothetical protein C1646_738886 [Rhizophagus diaphanus]|nr:hypothetical protein C1646_738886 [Rhizophagus diaphanus] [Rhizophagus sp. MUCL 43196]